MKLSFHIIVLATILFPLSSFSDEQYATLGYKCDQTKNLIEFRYFYYVNGTEILQTDEIDIHDYELINPWKLLKVGEEENKIDNTDLTKVEKICKIKQTEHLVSILPSPGNSNTLGRCGGQMSISVEIYIPPWYALKNRELYSDEKGSIVLSPYHFEGDCLGSGFITKSLTYNSEKLTTTAILTKLHSELLYE